jgi:hypothetical protein
MRGLWIGARRVGSGVAPAIAVVLGFVFLSLVFSSLSSILILKAEAQNQTATATKPAAKAATPSDDPQLYRNAALAFRYQVPFGWVDRTKEMAEGDETGKSAVLLAVFERPPESTGDTVNSAVVIASESVSSFPGLKKAEDYLGPLSELAASKGMKPVGEPYALEVESRELLRADFSKQLNDKVTMRQCTLVLLTKGQIVSFTFIAAGEDELDDIMDGLHFGGAKAVAH